MNPRNRVKSANQVQAFRKHMPDQSEGKLNQTILTLHITTREAFLHRFGLLTHVYSGLVVWVERQNLGVGGMASLVDDIRRSTAEWLCN
nr:hypothetical protein CFP56_74038 [Quercus suber]